MAELKDVTYGKLVNLRKTESFFIPVSWLNNILDTEREKYGIFLKNTDTMYRFIPTKTNKIIQFHLKLTVLEENFLQKLFQVFEKLNTDHKIQPIYSSGVCFVEEDCYYLFLIEHINEELEQKLKSLLSQLQGVEDVLIERYSIEK